MASVHFLIPAAGSGRRMGSDRNKLLLPLLGQPMIA
ncbi:MAG: 2-C-methyl-D-erythritol 4-phosphate cytidylyltransferase, partial [Nodosilinea sp.]